MATASIQHVLAGLLILTALAIVPVPAFGQANDFVIPASTSSSLNNIINGDTTATGERVDPDRAYVLERDGVYVVDGGIENDFQLSLRGAEGTGTRPVIFNVVNPATGTAAGNMFLMSEDLWLKDFIIVGFLEGVEGEINNVASSIVRVVSPGFKLTVDNVLMSQNRGQFVRTESAARVVEFRNSVLVNSGTLQLTNLGAGKAIDLREASIDTLLMQNNTFVNFQDRIVRHLNSTGAINHFIFDHNTVINAMSYHGLLSLGWTGESVRITNNLFVDAFALGEDPTDAVRQAEFTEHGELYPDGSARMAWIFNQPRTEVSTEWQVGNNVYTVTPEGQAFFDVYAAEGLLGEGSPLTWHINRQLDADSVDAFVKETVELANKPELMVAMMEWYRTPEAQGGAGRTKATTNFDPDLHDWDRRSWEYFDQEFDASYSETSAAFTAGDDGFPVGDLNWFPDQLEQWTSVAVERGPGELPEAYRLDQNYPNPFNPSTHISYEIPAAAFVSLKIYNVLGQEVAHLLKNREQGPGRYDVVWNGTDHAGRLLPTGLYVYQLRAGDVELTRKMLLVK